MNLGRSSFKWKEACEPSKGQLRCKPLPVCIPGKAPGHCVFADNSVNLYAHSIQSGRKYPARLREDMYNGGKLARIGHLCTYGLIELPPEKVNRTKKNALDLKMLSIGNAN